MAPVTTKTILMPFILMAAFMVSSATNVDAPAGQHIHDREAACSARSSTPAQVLQTAGVSLLQLKTDTLQKNSNQQEPEENQVAAQETAPPSNVSAEVTP